MTQVKRTFRNEKTEQVMELLLSSWASERYFTNLLETGEYRELFTKKECVERLSHYEGEVSTLYGVIAILEDTSTSGAIDIAVDYKYGHVGSYTQD